MEHLTTSLKTLLTSSREEAVTWLKRFQNQEENPNLLLPYSKQVMTESDGIISCLQESIPLPSDQEGRWSIGLGGHGLANISFNCLLRSPRLRLAIRLPYLNPFAIEDTDDIVALNGRLRGNIIGVCKLVVLLLNCECTERPYLPGNPEARLTLVADSSGCAYIIEDELGIMEEESNLEKLLTHLDDNLVQASDSNAALQIIIP